MGSNPTSSEFFLRKKRRRRAKVIEKTLDDINNKIVKAEAKLNAIESELGPLRQFKKNAVNKTLLITALFLGMIFINWCANSSKL